MLAWNLPLPHHLCRPSPTKRRQPDRQEGLALPCRQGHWGGRNGPGVRGRRPEARPRRRVEVSAQKTWRVTRRRCNDSNAKPALRHRLTIPISAPFTKSRSTKGEPFIVMQLLRGETLRDRHGYASKPPRQRFTAFGVGSTSLFRYATGLAAAHAERSDSSGHQAGKYLPHDQRRGKDPRLRSGEAHGGWQNLLSKRWQSAASGRDQLFAGIGTAHRDRH